MLQVIENNLELHRIDQLGIENWSDICAYILSNNDNEINYYFLGRQQFTPIWELQKTIHQKRIHNEINDVVLLLEHEHVYTFGKNADQNHLLPSYPSDTDVVQIDRGGDVTYHGPGQLIVYPIIDLHNYKLSVSWYMRTLEQTIIDVLSQYNIQSQRNDKLTGVWIEDEKICAMGVRLAKWVTMHGLALNNNPNMQYFDGMIPCGIFECGVTSIYEINQQAKTIIDLATEVGNLLHSHLMKERN
jgi:lipoyl(octanoyl) transferase